MTVKLPVTLPVFFLLTIVVTKVFFVRKLCFVTNKKKFLLKASELLRVTPRLLCNLLKQRSGASQTKFTENTGWFLKPIVKRVS